MKNTKLVGISILLVVLSLSVSATSITFGEDFNEYTIIREDNESYKYISEIRYCDVIYKFRQGNGTCSFEDYYTYLAAQHNDNILSINNTNVTHDLVVTGNVIADGFVEADDVIVHSDGFRDLTGEQLKTILINLGNLANGDIDKSKVPDYYKTDDGEGIRMWRLMIDVVVNLARHTYDKFTDIDNDLDVARQTIINQNQRINAIEQELCDFGRMEFC